MENMKINLSEAVEQIKILFEDNDIVELRCLKPNGKPLRSYVYAKDFANYTYLLYANNMNGYNIYFGVNPRITTQGDSAAVKLARNIFVDLDNVDDIQAFEELNESGLPKPTLAVFSGHGVHFYWRLKEPIIELKKWQELQKKFIACFTSADKAIFDTPRIMRLAGFLNLKNDPTVAKIIARNDVVYTFDELNSIEEVSFYRKARRYIDKCAGVPEGERNSKAYYIACVLQSDFGLSDEEAFELLRVWNEKNKPPLQLDELRRVFENAKKYRKEESKKQKKEEQEQRKYKKEELTEEEKKQLLHLFETVYLIYGTDHVYDGNGDAFLNKNAFIATYGKPGAYWYKSLDKKIIRQENIVFAPQGHEEGKINLFKGLRIEKDTRLPERLLEHLFFLCGEDENIYKWVLCWMAIQVQKLGTKLPTAIVMVGAEGCGKSKFWECYAKIFKPYSVKINQQTLENSFNEWLSRKMFILCEEVLASKHKYYMRNILKDLITAEYAIINEKFKNIRVEQTCANFVFLSNNNVPIIATEGDRRYCVIEVKGKRDRAYYRKLAEEIEDRGAERLYTYLLDVDLSDFDCYDAPPITKAKEELMNECNENYITFLRQWQSGVLPVPYASCYAIDLYKAYMVWCKITSNEPFTIQKFGRYMRKFCEENNIHKRHTEKGDAYIIKETDALQDFNEKLKAYEINRE